MMGFRADAIYEEMYEVECKLREARERYAFACPDSESGIEAEILRLVAQHSKLKAEYDRLTASPFEMLLKKQQEMN
jgi:hypothetical protein